MAFSDLRAVKEFSEKNEKNTTFFFSKKRSKKQNPKVRSEDRDPKFTVQYKRSQKQFFTNKNKIHVTPTARDPKFKTSQNHSRENSN